MKGMEILDAQSSSVDILYRCLSFARKGACLLDIGYLSALFQCNNLSGGDFCGKVLMKRKYSIGSVGMFVCKLKRQGGLGVQDGHMNQCLL